MKHLIIGTAGHIDHGKTSLIKMLTGIDCDTHKEEKARGITINLGFSHIDLPNGESAGIIDVPGHRDFINTMISGACGIDMVILVISADEGIMPQTSEHLNIISSLGIKQGIVALTKVDLVDNELIEIAISEISDFLKNSILENAPIIPISSATGKGKDNLVDEITKIASSFSETEPGKTFTMYIDRLFTVKGHGSVVTGSVGEGKINTGDDLFLIPGKGEKYRVRSIERHGKAVDSVQKGDRAAINLTGLKAEDFARGMMLSNKNLETTIMIDAQIKTFDSSPDFSTWTDIIFLSGTFQSTAKMHLLDCNKLSGGKTAIVQIHLGKEFSAIIKDRFIFRNSSDTLTLGGGYIIDNNPLHHKRKKTEIISEIKGLANEILSENNITAKLRLIIEKEPRPFSIIEISEMSDVSAEKITELVNQNPVGIRFYQPDILIHQRFDIKFEEKILSALQEYHSKNFLFDTGAETAELSGKIGPAKNQIIKDFTIGLLKRLEKEAKVENLQNTWIIKGHKAVIDSKIQAEIDWLEKEFYACADEKPALNEIEEKAITK
ncbi:MAG: selenocysteine-specific translation elongation factor [Bacteroidales bacterium]|nr:selenocysteine-specific translation elongation factor [Bacteroidales bacterium]